LRGGQKLAKNSKNGLKIPKKNKVDQKLTSKMSQKMIKKSDFLMAKSKK